MEKWQNQTEKQMLEQIRSSIGKVQLPVDSYNEQIMNRIEHMEIKGGSKLIKKTLAAACGRNDRVRYSNSRIHLPSMGRYIESIPRIQQYFQAHRPRFEIGGGKGLDYFT